VLSGQAIQTRTSKGKLVIEKIIAQTVLWSVEIGFNLKRAVSMMAHRLFDIVGMLEEREMQAAESWRSRVSETTDFGGPVFDRTIRAQAFAA
jgi:hypothetical protein